MIFKLILLLYDWSISSEITLRWMSPSVTDDKSSLVQVMAWCRQATSHYLSQCWSSSVLPYGITRPQWVKTPHMCPMVSKDHHFGQNWLCYNGNVQPCKHARIGPVMKVLAQLHTSISTSKFVCNMSDNRCEISATWRYHDMEKRSALLALCEGNPMVTGELHSKKDL